MALCLRWVNLMIHIIDLRNDGRTGVVRRESAERSLHATQTEKSRPPRSRFRLWVFVVGLALLALAGCTTSATGANESASAHRPFVIESTPGSSVKRLILTSDAAHRIGIKTELIAVPAAGGMPVIPIASVLYDKDGVTWAYTSPAPLTFLRQRIVLGPIAGNTAVLLAGPAPGTALVTVGATELYGAEHGVGGEQ
jgi:hypothetical protein